MFSFLRNDPPTLQLYGKLPLAKDYLRIGCGEHAARGFREWMDQGFSGAAGAEPPVPAYPMRFLVGDARHPLIGCLAPSSDEGGLRPFPFATLVERKRRDLAGSVERAPAELEPWWRVLEASFRAVDNYGDGQALLTGFRGRPIEPDAQVGELPAVEYEAWSSALWPDGPEEGLKSTLTALDDCLRDGHDGPLRLPLVADLPLWTQVVAWRAILIELGVGARDEVPTLFFPQGSPAGDEPAFVTVFRALRPAQACWLESVQRRTDREPGDLCPDGRRSAGREVQVGENVPSLADSIRGALATVRARAR